MPSASRGSLLSTGHVRRRIHRRPELSGRDGRLLSAKLGSQWALERVAIDVDTNSAVAEWTHYKTHEGTVLRGDEWYEFDQSTGLISEIRAYYASPQARDLQRLELDGFDYAGRGYSVEPRTREVDT